MLVGWKVTKGVTPAALSDSVNPFTMRDQTSRVSVMGPSRVVGSSEGSARKASWAAEALQDQKPLESPPMILGRPG